MWIDQLGSIIGEISTLTVFLFSCIFFLPLSHSFSATLETVSVWTVLGAIGLNAVLSAVRSVYSVVAVFREYKRQRQVLRVSRSQSNIQPTLRGESNAASIQGMTIRRGIRD